MSHSNAQSDTPNNLVLFCMYVRAGCRTHLPHMDVDEHLNCCQAKGFSGTQLLSGAIIDNVQGLIWYLKHSLFGY